jgi:hemerythrin superfamily protein
MDVTELLMQDHRAVQKLFAKYAKARDYSTIDEICQALETHSMLEEEIVYPRLAEIEPTLAQHAEDEHGHVKALIALIRSGSGDVASIAEQMRTAVHEHVQEEETKAFPAMRERCGSQLEEMGELVERRKRQLAPQQA